MDDDEQNSMLAVLCSQRDRFRLRLRETEEELRAARDRCQALTADRESSKADNVKLYEKMRFTQDYTQDRPTKGRLGRKIIPMAGLSSFNNTSKSQISPRVERIWNQA